MDNSNGTLHFAAALDNSQLRAGAAQARSILQGIGTTAVAEGDTIDKAMRSVGKAVAGVFAAGELKQFALQVATVRGEFQKLEVAFKTMLGSAQQADDLMAQMVETAATTPFSLQDVAGGAKQLLAYGLEAEKVNETLIRLGDIAAGLSVPLGDLVYLYGTTMTQGRLYTQDLNQFTARGIPLIAELAQQFGVAESGVKKLVEEGKVGFPQVQKAIEDLTGEGGRFGGLMAAQSQTIAGQISNLGDAVQTMFNEMGQSSEGVISDAIGAAKTLVENWQTIGKVLLTVIAAFGTYKAALLAVNVVQKINATLTAEAALQQKLAAMQGIALSQAQAMAAARTTLMAAAWNSLKVAMATNPIGIVLAVVSAAATAFGLFSDSTSEATEMTQKYGERAVATISRVRTLSTELAGLTKGSTIHKQAMEELNGILEQYGLQAINEGDSIDTINAKREQAIALIQQEAAERQRLNAIASANEEYAKGLADAQNELYKGLKEATSGTWAEWIPGGVGGNEELQKNAQAISTIIAQEVEGNIDLIANKTGDEYQKGLDKIYANIQAKMREIGISEETISSTWMDSGFFSKTYLVQNYINSVQGLSEANGVAIDTYNRMANSADNAAESTMTFGQRVAAVEAKLQGPNDGVTELYNNIRRLMQQYSQNTIGFTIKFDGEYPAWMDKLPLPELQRLAKHFTAAGSQAKGGATVNGKYMTKQELLQRGADYAEAAKSRQDAEDKKKQDEENRKKEQGRKDKASADNAAADARRQQEEADRRTEAIRKYREEVAEQTREAELDIAQQRVEAMEDGFEKQRLTIGIHYDRLVEENRKREKQMLEELAENRANEWANANPRATDQQREAYRRSLLREGSSRRLTAADLTAQQQAALEAYGKLAEEIRRKETESLYATSPQAMLAFLKDYGTYQERKLAIAKEYAAKIKAVQQSSDTAEQKGWRIRSLEAERDKATGAVDNEAVQAQIDWQSVFGSVTGVLEDQLKSTLEQLKQYVTTDEFRQRGAEDQKTVYDSIDRLTEATGGGEGTLDFAGLKQRMEALGASFRRLQEMSVEQSLAFRQLQTAQAAYDAAMQGGTQEQQDAAKAQLDTARTAYDGTKQSYAELQTSVREQATEIRDTTQATVGGLEGLASGLSAFKSGSAKGAFNGLQQSLQSLDKLNIGGAVGSAVSKLSNALSSAGIVGQIISGILGLLDVLKDGIGSLVASLVDTILGAVTGILKDILNGNIVTNVMKSVVTGVGGLLDAITFGGFSSWLGNGESDKTLEEDMERLSATNEALQNAIEELTDKLDDTAMADVADVYERQMQLLKESEANTQEQLRRSGAAYSNGFLGIGGSHSSNHRIDEAMESAEWERISKIVGQAVGSAGDFWRLTSEQMRQVAIDAPDLYAKIKKYADDGHKDAAQYMDDYIDYAKQREELEQAYYEKLTSYSFDSMRNEFKNALTNMEMDAETFSDNFNKMLSDSIAEALMTEKYDPLIKQLYEKWGEYMEDDGKLSEAEIADLRRRRDEIYAQMEQDRKNISQLTGYTGDTDTLREASSKGIATASQDSVDELNGRATAIQSHTFSINENTKLLLSTTQAILKSVTGIESNTDSLPERLEAVERGVTDIRTTVNDIAIKGIKIR